MTHESLVGLNVIDEAGYQAYRTAMMPLLQAHGGGFRYDFVVARTLRSEAAHPINRVFAIHFPDRASKDAFFALAEYRAVRARFFEPSVHGTTVIAEYDRP